MPFSAKPKVMQSCILSKLKKICVVTCSLFWPNSFNMKTNYKMKPLFSFFKHVGGGVNCPSCPLWFRRPCAMYYVSHYWLSSLHSLLHKRSVSPDMCLIINVFLAWRESFIGKHFGPLLKRQWNQFYTWAKPLRAFFYFSNTFCMSYTVSF